MDRIEVIRPAECWSLLAAGTVGRVVFTERALPAIRPVNYAVVGTHILLRSRGEGLAARLDGQVVAFEIDDVDQATRSGWSVVVTGTARVPRDAGELARLDSVALAAWAGPDHGTPVWITPGDVQGRRVQVSDPDAELAAMVAGS